MQFSDIITFTRSTGGGIFNAQGQYEWLPANTPRIDYDPVTGECRGLLIEEQRTNLFLNSELAGAVVGVVESGGSLPSGWFVEAAAGMQTEVIATGVQNGLAYVDIQASNISMDTGTYQLRRIVTTGTAGQSYTSSIYAAVLSVSGGVPRFTITEASGIYPGTRVDLTSGTLSRVSVTRSVVATTTPLHNRIQLARTGSSTDSLTLRIAAPMFELGSFPTSYIPTTTAQVTRAADIASVDTLPPWFNAAAGTFIIEHDAASGRPLLSSGANTIAVSQGAGKLAVAYDAAGSYVSHNGGAYVDGPVLTFGEGIKLMRSATAWANAHCASIRYYPRKLSQGEIA